GTTGSPPCAGIPCPLSINTVGGSNADDGEMKKPRRLSKLEAGPTAPITSGRPTTWPECDQAKEGRAGGAEGSARLVRRDAELADEGSSSTTSGVGRSSSDTGPCPCPPAPAASSSGVPTQWRRGRSARRGNPDGWTACGSSEPTLARCGPASMREPLS